MTYIAYLGSLLILSSFLMKDQIKLRILNSVGCGIFIWYSLLKSDYPIVFVNIAVVIINILYIIKSRKTK